MANIIGRHYYYNAEKDVLGTFQSLRERESMFDITIGCLDFETGEVRCMEAHRVLLSSFSPVLDAIIEMTVQQNQFHPFVHLAGISADKLDFT